MSGQLPSVAVAVLRVVGLLVSGRNPRAGWIYGICNQAAWLAYGWHLEQVGMMLLSLVYVGAYTLNLRISRGHRWVRPGEATEARGQAPGADDAAG